MKSIVLLCAVVALIFCLFSCKKDMVTPQQSPSITLVSSLSGQNYYAGEYIDVRWKSSNLPAGSFIAAVVTNNFGTGLIGVYAQPETGGFTKLTSAATVSADGYAPTTANDGEEVFQLPEDISAVYHKDNFTYGDSFKLTLVAVFPGSDGTWTTINGDQGDIEVQSAGFFTVRPGGCASNTGYSPVTGAPCSVPSH